MKIDSSFYADAFQFLIRTIRDADEDGTLERIYLGFQGVWEDIHDLLLTLPDLADVRAIDGSLLRHLAWHVGWTSEMESIVADLTEAELRKLILASAGMWKMKGSGGGLIDVLRIITGREVVLWDWFDSRWVLGQAGLWNRYLPNTIAQNNPILAGSTCGDRDEHRSVLWVSLEAGVQRQLIVDVVDLCRPINETIVVVYADFLFHHSFSGSTKWTDQGVASYVLEDTCIMLPQNAQAEVTVEGGTVGWDTVVWRNAVSFDSTAAISLLFRAADADNCYRATFGQDGAMLLQRLVAGVPTTLASGTLGYALPADEDIYTIIGVDVIVNDDGSADFAVWVNGAVRLSHNEAAINLLAGGSWRLANLLPPEVRFDVVVAYEWPPTTDVVDGS